MGEMLLLSQGAQASSGSSELPPAASRIAVEEASPVWVIWADRPDLSGKYRPHAASDRRSECPVEWMREAQQGLYRICYQASKHPFGGGSPHPVWALRDVDGIGVYATADAPTDVSSPTQSDWGLFEVCDSPPPAPEAIHVTVSLLTCAAFARELIQHDRDRIATGDITPSVLTFQSWLRLPEDILRCVIEFTPTGTECSWWRLAGLPIPERCETDLVYWAESVICSDDLSLFMSRQLCGTYYKSPRRCKDGQPQWVLEGSQLRAAVTSANGRWCLSLQDIAAPELTLAESMEIHCKMPPDQMVWGWSVQGAQDGAGVTVTRAPDFPRAVSSGTLPRVGSSGGFPWGSGWVGRTRTSSPSVRVAEAAVAAVLLIVHPTACAKKPDGADKLPPPQGPARHKFTQKPADAGPALDWDWKVDLVCSDDEVRALSLRKARLAYGTSGIDAEGNTKTQRAEDSLIYFVANFTFILLTPEARDALAAMCLLRRRGPGGGGAGAPAPPPAAAPGSSGSPAAPPKPFAFSFSSSSGSGSGSGASGAPFAFGGGGGSASAAGAPPFSLGGGGSSAAPVPFSFGGGAAAQGSAKDKDEGGSKDKAKSTEQDKAGDQPVFKFGTPVAPPKPGAGGGLFGFGAPSAPAQAPAPAPAPAPALAPALAPAAGGGGFGLKPLPQFAAKCQGPQEVQADEDCFAPGADDEDSPKGAGAAAPAAPPAPANGKPAPKDGDKKGAPPPVFRFGGGGGVGLFSAAPAAASAPAPAPAPAPATGAGGFGGLRPLQQFAAVCQGPSEVQPDEDCFAPGEDPDADSDDAKGQGPAKPTQPALSSGSSSAPTPGFGFSMGTFGGGSSAAGGASSSTLAFGGGSSAVGGGTGSAFSVVFGSAAASGGAGGNAKPFAFGVPSTAPPTSFSFGSTSGGSSSSAASPFSVASSSDAGGASSSAAAPFTFKFGAAATDPPPGDQKKKEGNAQGPATVAPVKPPAPAPAPAAGGGGFGLKPLPQFASQCQGPKDVVPEDDGFAPSGTAPAFAFGVLPGASSSSAGGLFGAASSSAGGSWGDLLPLPFAKRPRRDGEGQ